ncbi:MAG: hypothetical protein LDLANPLL_01896 [Turneriella sp.]|nr:hypothetical protein [Turneriella sp.]
MKKILTLALAVFFVFGACKSDPKAEMQQMMTSYIKAIKSDTEKLKAAKNSKEFAVGITSLTATLKKMSAEGKAFAKKYPDLKGKEAPVELKTLETEFTSTMRAAMEIVIGGVKYMNDPEVKAAMDAFQNLKNE